jgi:hypothetical protein
MFNNAGTSTRGIPFEDLTFIGSHHQSERRAQKRELFFHVPVSVSRRSPMLITARADSQRRRGLARLERRPAERGQQSFAESGAVRRLVEIEKPYAC